MTGNNKNIKFNHKKPSDQLDDFVHIYWEHINTSDKPETLTIFPDSFFKIIIIKEKGNVTSYFMTGLWKNKIEFSIPENAYLYGIKLKILAPEYIFQNEIATILQSHKDLPLNFLKLQDLKFDNIDSFAEQIEHVLIEKLSSKLKKIKANKLQLSQLLYTLDGNISVEEVSKQINWGNQQINRYLNKYMGVSLKTYLNLQKCYASYFHIREGEFYPANEYYDQAHFIREIKKHTGKTPKELYKKQNDHFIQLKFIQKK